MSMKPDPWASFDRRHNRRRKLSTHYDIYRYDPRGAWRHTDKCASLAAAKQVVRREKLIHWKIIKVDEILVSQSVEEAVSQG